MEETDISFAMGSNKNGFVAMVQINGGRFKRKVAIPILVEHNEGSGCKVGHVGNLLSVKPGLLDFIE